VITARGTGKYPRWFRAEKEMSMEWLEFSRWSDEVTRAVVAQRAMAHESHGEKTEAKTSTVQMREQLVVLLRSYPVTNPWGHPLDRN